MNSSPFKIGVAILIVAALGIFGFLFFKKDTTGPQITAPLVETEPSKTLIGQSVEGRAIESFTFGEGETHIAFVGGIHGGYEWNSVLLAYRFMDYLNNNPETIPSGISISVIPNANPDGVYKIIGKEGRFSIIDVPEGDASAGRFNANDVDLNRNFDCKWQSESTWRNKTVSAGTAPFSEPEARAIRDFVMSKKPDAVVFWHSQASAVYASECENGILPETLLLMDAYANAAGYNAVDTFDAYKVTGDAEGWLASIGIPSITVELSTHEDIEWDKNLRGIRALLDHFREF